MSDLSDPFTKMAGRIDLNAEQGFGGAVIIVPPGEDAQPIELLILNNSGDPGLFLATVQTMIGIRLQELDDKAKHNPFGVR